MTESNRIKTVTTIELMNYTEQRVDMWCKPVGLLLFCFCMETMSIYWLDRRNGAADVMYDAHKIRCNASAKRLSEIIRDYEQTVIITL